MTTTPTKIYDADTMLRIADLYKGLEDLFTKFEGGSLGTVASVVNPLYVFDANIVIRHKDNYTVGRIFIEDDNVVFELTDEDYGEPEGMKK
jgi:hypothetical protein